MLQNPGLQAKIQWGYIDSNIFYHEIHIKHVWNYRQTVFSLLHYKQDKMWNCVHIRLQRGDSYGEIFLWRYPSQGK